jgi:DNA-directed RNA polymerase specialized sigma24 family protein
MLFYETSELATDSRLVHLEVTVMGTVIPFAVPYEALADYEASVTLDEDPTHDVVVRDLDSQRIRRMVYELPAGERTAVWLKFGFDGQERTSLQVAEAMGVGDSTARRLVRRGLDRIADRRHELTPAA